MLCVIFCSVARLVFQFIAPLNHTPASAIGNTRIEESYVRDVYDAIAPHFSATRYKAWPKIAEFLNDQPPGYSVCDVGTRFVCLQLLSFSLAILFLDPCVKFFRLGCGNGKYLGVNPNLYMFGNDQSIKQIGRAHV